MKKKRGIIFQRMCIEPIEIKELCEEKQKYGERRKNSKFYLGVWAGA